MQVQRIQNHNQNFTALKITKPELEWDADVLLKFVKNKEVQKFVSGMDYLERDIYASCINNRTIDMEVIKKKVILILELIYLNLVYLKLNSFHLIDFTKILKDCPKKKI